MHFANPVYLWGIIFVPIYLIFLHLERKKKEALYIPIVNLLKQAEGKRWTRFLPFIQKALIILIIIFFSLTLARPQTEHQKEKLGKKGIDIIIALDVSQSMLAEDLKPNRMEAAKDNLSQFIAEIKDDRLGIIVFAGTAFTQSPLTFDYNIMQEYLKQISTKSINQNVRGLNGTAVGDAILAAINRFKKSEDRSKVLVLLTDGDANVGVDPQIAAEKAAESGIKIYTVGIGSKEGAPMPVTNMLGQKDYARNQDGSLMMATFNEEGLKKIAAIGSGQYFRAGDNESFKEVMAKINALEKREIKVNNTTEYTENFFVYLSILSVLLFFYVLFIVYKFICS
jgi:Ca-activated chloride channel homolog